MFEEQQEAPTPRRSGALRRAVVATALMGAVVAGGYGVAAAQTDEAPTTEGSPSTTAPDDDGTRPDGAGCDRDGDGVPDDGTSGGSSGGTAGGTSL